jgi:hypothetical protein
MAAVAGCLPGDSVIRPDYADKGWLAPRFRLGLWVACVLAWWLLVIVCVDTTGGAS